jgi:hypothetical protein
MSAPPSRVAISKDLLSVFDGASSHIFITRASATENEKGEVM